MALYYASYYNMTTEADYPYVPRDRKCNKTAVAKVTYILSVFTHFKSNDVAAL